MALTIYKQGHLDGLCGVYAFVNGYIHSLAPIKSLTDGSLGGRLQDDIFQHALRTIPRSKFPHVLWQGLDVDELERVCRKTCKAIELEVGWKHNVLRPFKKGSFKKATTFLEAVADYHANPPTMVILALDGLPGHWVALKTLAEGKIRLMNNGSNHLDISQLTLRAGRANRFIQEETIIVSLLEV